MSSEASPLGSLAIGCPPQQEDARRERDEDYYHLDHPEAALSPNDFVACADDEGRKDQLQAANEFQEAPRARPFSVVHYFFLSRDTTNQITPMGTPIISRQNARAHAHARRSPSADPCRDVDLAQLRCHLGQGAGFITAFTIICVCYHTTNTGTLPSARTCDV